MGIAVDHPKRSIKPVALMSDHEREHLIGELEREHRTAIASAAKTRREIRRLNAELEAKHQRINEIEDGIAALREVGER